MREYIDRNQALEINNNHHGEMPNEVNHKIWCELSALPTVPAIPIERIKQLREEIVSFRQHMDKFMLTSQKNRFDSIIADLDNMIKEYEDSKDGE